MDQPLSPSSPAQGAHRLAFHQANQMSNTLRLIQGTIHEINNDLGPLVGYLSIMEIGANAEPKFIEAMQESVQRLQRHLARISDELKPPKKHLSQRQPFEELVEQSIEPLQSGGFFRRVPIMVHVDPNFEQHGIPWVEVCPADFRHLLTNLLANAIDATILQSPQLGRFPKIQINLRAQKAQVQIEVQDQGPGLDGLTRPQVFEPFHSSNPSTKLGLGLCVAQDLAKKIGARLDIEASPEGGSMARITLKRASN